MNKINMDFSNAASRVLKLIFLSLLLSLSTIKPQENLSSDLTQLKMLSLNECIDIALENNHKIKTSKYGISIAESQIEQSESGYWPQLLLKANYSLLDQDPLFVMPAFKMKLPSVALPGFNLQLDDIDVPQQNVKLMDKQNIQAALELVYPIYTGGKVQSLNKQAEYGYEIAKQELRKTDLEVKYDVIRFYYAVVLSKNLYHVGEEAVDRLGATLSLTESLYKNGSGKVTKIDYLRTKIMVDQARTFLSQFENNIKNSKAALRFSIGINAEYDFDISETEIPFTPDKMDANSFLAEVYKYNPDWLKLNSAVNVYNSKLDEAKSGYYPNIAFFANLRHNINSYDYGIVNSTNRTMMTIGVGLEMPLFSGFRTSSQVDEAELGIKKIEEEKLLLNDALILQINEAYNNAKTNSDQVEKILEAANTAEENRSLNERAFQQDLVEAKDLVEAQIMESFVKAQYLKALYDHILSQAKLDLLTGTELKKSE